VLRTVGHLGRLMRVGYAFAREGVLGLGPRAPAQT